MKKRNLEKIEHYIDKSIPYLLLVLLIIIVIDLFYSERFEHYAVYSNVIDLLIISVFAIDLGFKYKRANNIPEFLRKHWLEIIAIFPFYLILRLVEGIIAIARISESLGEGQRIFHEGVELTKLTKEGELLKSTRLSRAFRPIQRIPRLLESSKFFEKPEKVRKHR